MTPATTEPPPDTASGSIRLHPADVFMNLIVALLAPMFLGATAGDIGLARMAAAETVNAYRNRNQADLLAVAQIIGFGLAALGSLCRSMEDDISLSMTLRLRGNAVSLNRAAEQNRRVLRDPRAGDNIPHHAPWTAAPETPLPPAMDESPPEPPLLPAAAAQELAAEAEARLRDAEASAVRPRIQPPAPTAAATPLTAEEKRHQQMWAIAMVKESADLTASLPSLPPIERKTASIRAAALSSTAHALLTGGRSPPPISAGQAAPMRPNGS